MDTESNLHHIESHSPIPPTAKVKGIQPVHITYDMHSFAIRIDRLFIFLEKPTNEELEEGKQKEIESTKSEQESLSKEEEEHGDEDNMSAEIAEEETSEQPIIQEDKEETLESMGEQGTPMSFPTHTMRAIEEEIFAMHSTISEWAVRNTHPILSIHNILLDTTSI